MLILQCRLLNQLIGGNPQTSISPHSNSCYHIVPDKAIHVYGKDRPTGTVENEAKSPQTIKTEATKRNDWALKPGIRADQPKQLTDAILVTTEPREAPRIFHWSNHNVTLMSMEAIGFQG